MSSVDTINTPFSNFGNETNADTNIDLRRQNYLQNIAKQIEMQKVPSTAVYAEERDALLYMEE
jgi:hypothetical protein